MAAPFPPPTASSSASSPLSAPVGSLLRPTHTVAPEDSLARAAAELRRNGGDIIPVARDNHLCGIFSETDLARAIAEGTDLRDPVRDWVAAADEIAPYASGAEALRKLAEEAVPTLVVVDDQRRVLGLISATDLVPRRRVVPRPASVGGMATPFGVYLTNGVVRGGAGSFALLCTGSVMFLMLFGAQTVVSYSMPSLMSLGLPVSWGSFTQSLLGPMLFLLAMRLAPLAGTHAAEHQVVHAIERGEDLDPDVVRRMPRVHPRCGTNLAAAATLFMGIFATEWIAFAEVRLIVAFLITMSLWRPLGSLLQEFVTTRPATDRQLQSGIVAAEQLLENHAKSRIAAPSIGQRLWNSGLLHVMAGSAITAAFLYAVAWQFNLPLDF